jgi:hypothetical protein
MKIQQNVETQGNINNNRYEDILVSWSMGQSEGKL